MNKVFIVVIDDREYKQMTAEKVKEIIESETYLETTVKEL